MKLFICAIFLAGCATTHQKPLFSNWSSTTIGWQVSISAGQVVWTYDSGGECKSDAVFGPNYTIVLTDSTAVGILPDGAPGCDQFNNTWTYYEVGSILTLCEPVLINGKDSNVCNSFQ